MSSQKRETAAARGRGRPRDPKTRAAILRAARELLEENGPTGVTMEGIAARSGVSRPTIYRTWRNSYEVAMAAFLEQAPTQAPVRASSRAIGELRQQLRKVAELFATRAGRGIAAMVAAAEPETELAKAFRNRFILASREEGRAILRRAVEQGEVRPDIDYDVTLDLLYAPIYFRLLLGHGQLTANFTDGVLEQAMFGLAAKGSRRRTPGGG